MRKDKSLRTYGRHKNRVIVADVWLSDKDKKQTGIFSTSSDDSSRQTSIVQSSSSSEAGALSLNSTGNSEHSLFSSKPSRIQTRSTRKVKEDKENPQRQKKKQGTKRNKDAAKCQKQIFSISSSTESSVDSEKKCKTRALRDRNQKIDYNDSANMKKQLRGMASKRKRPVRTCNNLKPFKESSMDFSDFDNYSLLISDSPPVDVIKVSNTLSVETSTPVAKRTRCKEAEGDKMKVTDISHIEVIESPGVESSFPGVDTPESAHSQSLFNTPSVLSSNCSEVSNWQRKTGESINSLTKKTGVASVRLEKLRESFIAAAVAGSSGSHLAESRRNHTASKSQRLNNSESLFSTPNGSLEKNVLILTERLRQVRCGQLYNDSIDEEASCTSENDKTGEESDENGEDEESNSDSSEEAENGSNVSTNCDLSAIHEDDEASETESEDEVEDEDASTEAESSRDDEGDSESESDTGKIVTRSSKKSSTENLQRLSESLLMNHVNKRRTTKPLRSRNNDSEINNLAEELENSHIDSSDSNCTLYMLNNECSVHLRKTGSIDLSVHHEEDSEGSVESKDSSESKLEYHTAQSTRHSEGDYQTAEDSNDSADSGDDEEDDDEEEIENDEIDDDSEMQIEESSGTPVCKKYSLRGKFQDLQNSFSEMLTPKRKKSSLVPLSAQARVLLLCDQTEAVTFRTALSRTMISKCKKIGEGVYGEVFRSYNNNGDAVAIKIIPIEGDFEVNDEPQKKFSEILPEVVIAKELSNLRHGKSSMTSSYCQVNNVSCVKGKYPAELIKQWDLFHKNKGSENDRPDVFPEKQLYIVFEFADCGTDLESYKFDTIQQAKSVISQVGYALAVAEETLQFEHRDLHWGNVLVRPTDQEDIHFRLFGKPISVPTHGVEASVIDFTMSRLTKDGCTVYITIPDDDTLFDGQGDYQFDIYRQMKTENKGNWEKFCPYTNVLWLHYLADKLVYATKYDNQTSRQGREVLREFRQFMSTMLKYRSACEMAVDSLFLNS